MTTPAQIAAAVENARVKIAAGTGDYLDDVVSTLWDQLGDQKMRRIAAEEELAHVTEGKDAALALLRDDNMPSTWPGSFCTYPLTDECAWAAPRGPCYQHGKRDLLAQHPTANEQPKGEDDHAK